MVSLRVAPAVMKALHEYVVDYNRAHVMSSDSLGEPDVITESIAMRRALVAGLKVLRAELAPRPRKGGAR